MYFECHSTHVVSLECARVLPRTARWPTVQVASRQLELLRLRAADNSAAVSGQRGGRGGDGGGGVKGDGGGGGVGGWEGNGEWGAGAGAGGDVGSGDDDAGVSTVPVPPSVVEAAAAAAAGVELGVTEVLRLDPNGGRAAPQVCNLITNW